jgi:aspartyl-tRNA(Asn)/glutamyl-tRNA(Gln) amidotransferase subunit C
MKGEAGPHAESAETSAEESGVKKHRWRFGAKRQMINDKVVSYVADLANLELTDQERQRMVRDLSSILDYIDRLNQLDTTNVPPMAQALGTSDGGQPAAAWREDELRPSLDHDLALKNGPSTSADFFKVPKVIEK